MASSVQSSLMSYDEAAHLLRIKRESIKQLVMRGHLHSVPAPEDRRRRQLLRTEVEAYASAHAGKWSYHADQSPLKAQIDTALPAPSPQLHVAGAASVAAIALLIGAFRQESDTATCVLLIGAIIALGLILILEMQRQGKLDTAQRRKLEQLAKHAEKGVETETFLTELEQLLATS